MLSFALLCVPLQGILASSSRAGHNGRVAARAPALPRHCLSCNLCLPLQDSPTAGLRASSAGWAAGLVCLTKCVICPLRHAPARLSLQDSLAASFKASSAAEVAGVTNQLLAKLGDPYTRLLQGDDATALEAQEEGKVGYM